MSFIAPPPSPTPSPPLTMLPLVTIKTHMVFSFSKLKHCPTDNANCWCWGKKKSSLYLIMETKTCTSTVVCIDSSDFLPVKRSFCGTQNPQEFHFSRYFPPKKYFYIFQITLVLFKLKHRFLTDERHSSVGLICLRWTCTMYSTAPVDSNSVCSTYVSTFDVPLTH